MPLSSPNAAPEMTDGTVREGDVATFADATSRTSYNARLTARYQGPVLQRPPIDVAFFRRPLPLTTFTWGSPLAPFATDPYSAYFANASVTAKLRNVPRLRFTANFRVQVTGNPYSYGRLRIAYHPYPGTGGTARFAQGYGNKFSMSQMLGGLLDPSCNDILEFSIPYHGVNDYLNTDVPRSVPTGPYGQLWIDDQVSLLTYGQAAVTPVSVTIYMYLTDLEVQDSTPVPYSIPEAKDEYAKGGPVQRAASAVAAVTASLTDVPVIGTFARATTIGAQAVSGIASLFGWAAPTALPERSFVRHSQYGAMSTMVPDSSYKLALDPKQELSVGPSIVAGTDSDDMALLAVAARPSLLRQALWSPSQAAATVLDRIPVTPAAMPVVGASQFAFTPIAFASLPFTYWNGTIVYTIEVVASRFHTGRLLVSWVSVQQAPTDNLTQTAPSVVIDLSGSRIVRLAVAYDGPTPWKRIKVSDIGALSLPDPTNAPYWNGYLIYTVLDPLTTALATDTVNITTYISAGEDYRLQVPSLQIPRNMCWTGAAASGMVGSGLSRDVCEIDDVQLLGPSLVPPEVTATYFGQAYYTMRDLIKTFTPYTGAYHDVDTSTNSVQGSFDHPTYPYPGNTFTQSGNKDSYNYWTYYSWFSQAYLGVRGGTRWKVRFTTPNSANYVQPLRQRIIASLLPVIAEQTSVLAGNAYFGFANQTSDAIMNYLTLASSRTSPQAFGPDEIVEIDAPSQNPSRFAPGWYPNIDGFGNPLWGSGTNPAGFRVAWQMPKTGTDTAFYADVYQAGSEDASFSWFVCGPILYLNTARVT